MFLPRKKPRAAWSGSWHPSEVDRSRQEPLPGCERLLPGAGRHEESVECDEQTMARLDESIAVASTYLTEKWIATTSLINPMLEVWEAANAIHPAVARPVEELLTMLIHRTTVTPDEIRTVADEVRGLALQASIIAGGIKVS
jgi:hypothetical protein